jgi:glycosyltransferase involved in cell wall biosynthesis
MQKLDVIILSYTKDLSFYGLTQRCVSSLFRNNTNLSLNVIIVETNSSSDNDSFFYNGCKVVHPCEDFNYNKFLNIGLQYCESDFVLMCNNDLIFGPNSAEILLQTMILHNMKSASPLEPNRHKVILTPDEYKSQFLEGYEVEKYLVGWCICAERKMLCENKILDENFLFWYQDNDYANSLKKLNIKHFLVNGSHVYHEFSASHRLMGDRLNEMTHDMKGVYKKKWQV